MLAFMKIINDCVLIKEKIGKFCPNQVILTGAYSQNQNKQLLNYSCRV